MERDKILGVIFTILYYTLGSMAFLFWYILGVLDGVVYYF